MVDVGNQTTFRRPCFSCEWWTENEFAHLLVSMRQLLDEAVIQHAYERLHLEKQLGILNL